LNFFSVPAFLPWLYPQLTWRIATTAKDLYLTFDDGPVPGPTEFVLEQLEKFGAKATFFCIGDNVKKHPEVFHQVVKAGHAVGNHTFNHLSGWKTSRKKYSDNIHLCEEQMKQVCAATGIVHPSSALFRPPYGRIKRRQIQGLREWKIIMWDVLTHDYAQNVPAERCLKGSVSAVRPGSILVFHDSHKAYKNMSYVLPRLLDHFANQGYSFKLLG
jgi:peptidoglycan/xylan/chitin deacetylase (PgdA/CDA1 family)